jgi:L-erythro-3,5-diaminohexanoate dehydrogenase
VLPQAAGRLDARRELWPDEVRIRVERLNLDAASYRQLERTYAGDGDAIRAAVLDIVASRGKMQNPETGSGGMAVGKVEEVGERSPLSPSVDERVATLVSLTLTPLVIEDALQRWDGRSEQVPRDDLRGAIRPLNRRGTARRTQRRSCAVGDGRLRRTGAHRPCREAV